MEGSPERYEGWKPWVMWGIPAFIFLVAFFHRVAPGVVAKELMESFGATGTLIGFLSAAYFYVYAALMIPAGLLVDAFGPRRVVAVGGSVMGVGTLLMGSAISTGPLFAGRLLVGLGASVTFVGALKVAALWFPPRRFGTLSGLTATTGMLGSLMATLPLAVVAGVIGWRWSFHLVGLLTLLGSLLCWAIVRDYPSSGLWLAAPPSQSFGSVLEGAWQVIRNPYTWPPFATFFCLYSATGNLMLWVVPYLRDVYGLSTQWASVYATAPSLALLVSAPLTGYLSDRVLARRRLPYLTLSWVLVGLWAVFALTLGALPLWGMYALFFAMGLSGASFVLTWPMGREVNPPRLAGVAVAVVNLGGFLGVSLTQGMVGALLDSRWAGAMIGGARVYPLEAYRAAFGVCSGFVLATALLAFLIRETRCRNIYHELFPGTR